jgi:hypothetical protein
MDRTEIVREAMRILGSAKTPAKRDAVLENLAKANAQPMTEERRQKLRDAQAARRERERMAKGVTQETAEKRSPGRPRTTAAPDPTAPKRPRGRPKKTASPTDTGSSAP